jgi:prepilin peptidase CpaA
MIATLVLLLLLTIATVTDIVWQKIYNATTYTGLAAALVLCGIRSMLEVKGNVDATTLDWLSPIGFGASFAGLAICGGLMLFSYILFGVGGGDVKLIAMMGAFLGAELGLEALLWTFLFAAVVALAALVWREGAIGLVVKIGGYLAAMFKTGLAQSPVEEDRRTLQIPLYLGPCALGAALVVCFDLVRYLPSA